MIRINLRSPHVRRFGIGAVGLAVVVATFVFVLPRIADYRDVWAVVKQLSWPQVGFLLTATAFNLATYAPPWQAALPGISYRNAFVVSMSSSASTYLAPGGPAVGVALSYGMLRSWGFKRKDVTLAVALVGLGVFVIAASSYAAGLSSRRLARWAGNLSARIASWALRIFRRGPVSWTGETFAGFRAEAVDLLSRRWHVLTAATLAGQLTVFFVLLACLRVFDVPPGQVSLIEAFAAWALVRLIGSIPITPGGLGIVELGLTTALVGFGGGNAQVVTAVLVYRFLTIVPTLLLGLLAGATWKRHRPPQALEEGSL